MRALPVLFRLILSAALVLNGVGSAAAAAQMQLNHAGAIAAAAHADHTLVSERAPAGEAPCHDGKAGSTPGLPDPAKHSGPPELGGRDCCKTLSCDCGCLSSVTGVAIAALGDRLVVDDSAPAWPRRAGHRPPPLPQLIRPPIG